jgi:hypothetical protein
MGWVGAALCNVMSLPGRSGRSTAGWPPGLYLPIQEWGRHLALPQSSNITPSGDCCQMLLQRHVMSCHVMQQRLAAVAAVPVLQDTPALLGESRRPAGNALS